VTGSSRRALAVALLAASCAGGAGGPVPTAPPRPHAGSPAIAGGRYGAEPNAPPTPVEADALAAAREVAAGGRTPPHVSGALVLAARELARRAADGDADPLARAHLRAALAGSLAFDPAPFAALTVSRTADVRRQVAGALAGAPHAPTHLGAGVEVRGGRAWVVVLLSLRAAALSSFPREVSPGETATLRGELTGLDRASVHLTNPSGESRTVALDGGGAPRSFSAPIRFDMPGRWVVEVVGQGQSGPEVAALLAVSCGGAPLHEAAAPDERDPVDLGEAEARVVAAVNATRRAAGLPPVQAAPELAAVARRHSEAMLSAGVVAHVVGVTGTVTDRLRGARVPFAFALENVARGASALAAHRAIEESPAHRQNLLSRKATRVGCGVARGRLSTGDPIIYLTEVLIEPVEDGADDRMTREARVREAIWAERARRGAPPLVSDPRLDELARDAVRAMLRAGRPSPGDLGARALALGRNGAGAEAFVAARPSEAAARSTNVARAEYRRVGVSVAVGNDSRYGAGQLWIAVVYTD
jgi:uncharacterized protein YkwD